MGTSQFLFIGVTDEWASIVFQWTFAATSTTIVSGAVAGRIKFVAYVWLATLQTTFIYPLAAHWVWDAKGWLYKLGVVDLAGDLYVSLMHFFACHLLGTIHAWSHFTKVITRSPSETLNLHTRHCTEPSTCSEAW
jgi:ammonia channel protein AmtB